MRISFRWMLGSALMAALLVSPVIATGQVSQLQKKKGGKGSKRGGSKRGGTKKSPTKRGGGGRSS